MFRIGKRQAGAVLVGAGLFLGALAAQTQPSPRAARLQALAPSFWRLVPRNGAITRVATGFGFTEGPVWDSHGFLWVSDETLNRIFQVDVSTGSKREVIALGDPDGNTYDKHLRLLDCASVLRAIIRLSPDGKSYSIVANRYQGKRLNSPNDVVLGPGGAIYFTDPTSDLPKGDKQEIPFEGIYRIASDGQVQLLTKQLQQPNGLAFSPDGKKLYIDEDAHRSIWVFDFHFDGTISNGRLFGVEPSTDENEVPDGMKVDTQGNLYVVGPKGIWVWSPDGRHLGTIVLPEQPANLAWGGTDYSTLYMTAETSVYRVKTMARGFVPYL
jgi:gluconolactonase